MASENFLESTVASTFVWRKDQMCPFSGPGQSLLMLFGLYVSGDRRFFSGLMEKANPKLVPSFLECRTCVIFWVPGILELSLRVWLQGLCRPHFLLLTADYSISLYTQPRGWGKSGWLRSVLPKGSIWTDPSHNSLWCMMELGVRREGRVSGETGPRARVSLLY